MKNSIKLREKAAELAAEARSDLDKISEKTSPEQARDIEARFDEIMKDHDEIIQRAEREERLEKAEKLAGQGLRGNPDADNDIEGRSESGAEQNTPEYDEVFERAVRYGVSELSKEERGILMIGRGGIKIEDMPKEVRAQSTGTDSAGGYTVPEGFSGEIDKALAIWGPMWDANIVREYNTATGNLLPWPTVDDTGNTGRIKAENDPVDDDGSDDVTFGRDVFSAYVYDTGIVRIPMELLQDSAFDMESLLDDLFAERLGRTGNAALTTGTGTNQPQGIVTGASVGVTVASATAITSDEFFDLQHSVDPAYRQSPKCRWQFNDTTLKVIRKLKDGQGNYLWQMGDVRQGEPNMLLDKPYSVNNAMANIATGNRSVIFGDHSRYVVRKVRGYQLITLRERYAENFQIGMVGFKRFDGGLINTAAVKCLVHP